MIDIELLSKLTSIHGTGGDERDINNFLTDYCKQYTDDVHTDNLGNCIAHLKGNGNGQKILLAAHMDVCGFMVTRFEKCGVVRFVPVGGLSPFEILQAPVKFRNGVVGVISADENKIGKELKLEDMFIDIGAKDMDEAKTMVKVGDTAIYDVALRTSKNRVFAPYLDNRAGCFMLVKALENLSKNPENVNDVYFVFTVQEEVGTRGIGSATYNIQPDKGIAVDVTCPDDLPGAEHNGTTTLGEGAAIKIMDRSVISSISIVNELNALAEKYNIKSQADILYCGGTDGGNLSRTRGGVLTGGISISSRYTHSMTECVDLLDLAECVKLITAFCEN